MGYSGLLGLILTNILGGGWFGINWKVIWFMVFVTLLFIVWGG